MSASNTVRTLSSAIPVMCIVRVLLEQVHWLSKWFDLRPDKFFFHVIHMILPFSVPDQAELDLSPCSDCKGDTTLDDHFDVYAAKKKKQRQRGLQKESKTLRKARSGLAQQAHVQVRSVASIISSCQRLEDSVGGGLVSGGETDDAPSALKHRLFHRHSISCQLHCSSSPCSAMKPKKRARLHWLHCTHPSAC